MMLFLLKWLLLFHPFYTSLTEIDHNPKDAELEISIRIITNDLEETLKKYNPTVKVDLLNMDEVEKKKSYNQIFRYVNSRFKLSVNNKPCAITYLGFENVEENTLCYFEVKGITEMQKLHITNTILYDWQPTQTNMHVVDYKGQIKTRELTNPASESDFTF